MYAFHEKWYQYEKNMKRTFMFMIMANSLEIKLSTFEKYNLSLSSFMMVSFKLTLRIPILFSINTNILLINNILILYC